MVVQEYGSISQTFFSQMYSHSKLKKLRTIVQKCSMLSRSIRTPAKNNFPTKDSLSNVFISLWEQRSCNFRLSRNNNSIKKKKKNSQILQKILFLRKRLLARKMQLCGETISAEKFNCEISGWEEARRIEVGDYSGWEGSGIIRWWNPIWPDKISKPDRYIVHERLVK